MNKYKKGKIYEEWTKHFLIGQGLVFVQQNYHCRWGELDLIMRHREWLVFVEVRYRRNVSHGAAQETLTLTKQRRLYLSAQLWMQHFCDVSLNYDWRFDLIAITGSRVSWLRNILTVELGNN